MAEAAEIVGRKLLAAFQEGAEELPKEYDIFDSKKGYVDPRTGKPEIDTNIDYLSAPNAWKNYAGIPGMLYPLMPIIGLVEGYYKSWGGKGDGKKATPNDGGKEAGTEDKLLLEIDAMRQGYQNMMEKQLDYIALKDSNERQERLTEHREFMDKVVGNSEYDAEDFFPGDLGGSVDRENLS
ncbi:MAG: hypothetical protein ACLFTQ_00690 [Candidatus Aenigmatarchaeota archaeon]